MSLCKKDQTVRAAEENGDILLPDNFVPGSNDVVCARGKSYWDHAGNIMYRQLIGGSTDKYSMTTNKLEKTLIVSEIVEAIHKRGGRFVKKLRKGGPWVEVDEVFAREKVGQSLRDGLHDKYKSSTKAKKQRRSQVNEKFNGDIEKVIFSNRRVSNRIQQLTKEVEKNGALASDYSIISLFSRANSDILESIKKDASMLNQYQDATVAANVEVA
mmetsp:Transcript_118601/g.177265  ORF Transcript_118601/g.177265 Transcript_118601/m.177265 type:complete len:214 (-) Transcript_118601:311-952(-)|eukprot:CAMPEP_0117032524 /NCGR_PEP_ID=MMETSP0472-20121206/23308_1 /TAXON_ID=693140 ORGANISM="Tiarina fusus, Strain LIS" /NCGR_SAMPLE_ID=MMETSP0472 /ASSEMBLY_ACC=CAM_ASM_000603 /LENGTH=213 /DNA_ID=CAMNT_0004741187 /DNA_START=108 /DNA_END=749 /DNA_ORIENTATION=-